MKSSQNGNVLVVVLIIAVTLTVLGVVGYLLWNNLSNQDQKLSGNSSEEKSDNNQPDKDSGYLKIDAWNVRFKLADGLENTEVIYSIEGDTLSLTTKRIEAIGGECTKKPFNSTITITRYSESPGQGPADILNDEQPIGGYYYTLYGPSAACSMFDENSEMTQEQSQIEIDDRAALRSTAATISTI